MNKLTAEKCRQEIEIIKGSAGLGIEMSMRNELVLQAMEIALPLLEQQDGWISCSERMPPSKTGVLVGCQYGYGWATKWATLIHGHPDASKEGWLIPGASWVPTHWHELPAPPQPTTDTYRQIENDGWIEWSGGECPVSPKTIVAVRYRKGKEESPGEAGGYFWDNRGISVDIIAYRVIENDGREE